MTGVIGARVAGGAAGMPRPVGPLAPWESECALQLGAQVVERLATAVRPGDDVPGDGGELAADPCGADGVLADVVVAREDDLALAAPRACAAVA